MQKPKQDFNLIISGIGGQGLLTLLKILSEAALLEKKNFKSSELHGLSQRGGSVKVHFRLGEEISSPLVSQGQADLIIGLEIQEALRNAYFASKERGTIFLVNDYFVATTGKRLAKKISSQKKKGFLENFQKFSKETILVSATDICQKELGTSLTAGVFLISLAAYKKLIPLKEKTILKALKKVIPEKFIEINLKTFDLAKKI